MNRSARPTTRVILSKCGPEGGARGLLHWDFRLRHLCLSLTRFRASATGCSNTSRHHLTGADTAEGLRTISGCKRSDMYNCIILRPSHLFTH